MFLKKLLDEIAAELQELSSDHNDLIGAAVSAEKITGVESPYVCRARIVVYIRPENMAAVEEAEMPELALRRALNATEPGFVRPESAAENPGNTPTWQKGIRFTD